MVKKTPSTSEKRRRIVDAEDKVEEQQANKLFKPIIEPINGVSSLTSPFLDNIKVEEVEYTEVPALQNMSKSDDYFEDPSKWTNLRDEDIKEIVRKGPIQVRDISFPKRNNRKFTVLSYQRTLANGRVVPRTWLIYSRSQDTVYCFCCYLFATKKISQALSSTGCCDWPHLSAILKSHESSNFHMQNFKSWKFLEKSLTSNQKIDAEFESSMRAETKHWVAVTQRLFSLVKFLGSQALSFQGSSKELYDVNNGNFLQLVEEVASFDSVLGEHLRRVINLETQNKYLSENIQNDIASIISTAVVNKIVSMAKEAKYFSIIVDSTPDKSLTEEFTIVVRFVHNNYKTFEVQEHFLGFLKEDLTGTGLSNTILDKLELHNISLSNCRGQSYDHNSNIKAKEADAQQRIITLEPRTFFVPCYWHSLSLVITDSARCSLEAVKFFDIFKCLYNFLSSSTRRWDLFKKNKPNLTLKPLSETRWESMLDASRLLKTNLGDVYETLIEISEKGNAEEKITAESLGNKIFDFNFICCSLIWFDILEKINITSGKLQNPSANLSASIQALQNTQRNLFEMMSDEKFDNYVQSAKLIAIGLEIPCDFRELSCLRSGRIKKEKDFEFSETISASEFKFKTEFYFKILDKAIACITEIFEQLEMYDSNFSFLTNISECSKNRNLRLSCHNLQKALKFGESEDLDGAELYHEILVLSPLVRPNSSSLEVLNFIFSSNLDELSPNLVIALLILNTLPVTVTPGERGFSKLKLIKSHLRATATEERLEDLSIMAIENELVKSLDYDDLITEFAKAKANKILVLD